MSGSESAKLDLKSRHVFFIAGYGGDIMLRIPFLIKLQKYIFYIFIYSLSVSLKKKFYNISSTVQPTSKNNHIGFYISTNIYIYKIIYTCLSIFL